MDSLPVGAITHQSALDHDTGPRHVERRQRIDAILGHLRATGLHDRLVWSSPDPAPAALVEMVHDPHLLAGLEELERRGERFVELDTRIGPGSVEAALRASQGAVDAARRVIDLEWSAAFVLMRPPGHHATRTKAMGFCLTNHVAVAARWAVREAGLRRVAILDWDVHHGNGTQDIFWDDDRVMYASIHQYGPDPGTGLMTYPGTGWVQETGTGGTIINVPLPAGGGEDAYSRALDELVVPAIRGFGPELLLVSAGFDAHARDPLVSMELSAGAYYRFAERLRGIGRGCVLVLEGGYDLEALAWSAGATVSSLLGLAQPAGLPAGEERAGVGEPRAHDWVDAAIEAHRP